MDEKKIQLEASEALLDIGVSVPFKPLRVPFRKKPVYLRMTMQRTTLGRLIELSREWLSVGMTLDGFPGEAW